MEADLNSAKILLKALNQQQVNTPIILAKGDVISPRIVHRGYSPSPEVDMKKNLCTFS